MEKNTTGVPACHLEGITENDTAQSNQDTLNRITLNNDLAKLIAGNTPDDATLDLLLEYPDIAKEWLLKAASQIHKLECQTEIGIDTTFGRLFAGVSGDPHYPGIHICIEQQDGGVNYDKQLALVECTPDMPRDGEHSLRLMVWNSDNEDYTNDFSFFEGTEDSQITALESAEKTGSNNMFYAAAAYGDFFKIYEKGITVKLSFSGFAYTGYSQFFDDHPQFNELKARFAYEKTLPVNTPLTVLGWGVHCYEATVVYVLEDPKTHLIHLCGADCARYITVLSHKAEFATREESDNRKKD